MTRVVACAIALVFGVSVAAAQPKPEELQRAAALYDRGKRHFDIAEYTAAIAAWKEAYLLSSEPLLLFNIAQAHRLSGDCAQANRFYLNYKRVQPRPPNQAELDSAMSKCAGVAPATGDTTPTGTPPLEPAPPNITPEQPPITQAPPATQQPTPDTVEIDQGRIWRLSGLAIGGAGVVAGTIAIVYAIRASEKADDISSQPPNTTFDNELQQAQSDGQSAQTRARIFGVVSVAALIGGAALYYYGHTRTNVKVDVAVAPRGDARVMVTCGF